ncbi:co-chaperone Hsc20 [Phanerochaete sordida]|uniref:Co-chaperone Hsc20 n=1 Tax=Phanerochaete sordida TaxID=48140 RepID=A0A9P3G1D8_9APHY|nr:co-chaperone Hsc20 [Phanerochaete sordida]
MNTSASSAPSQCPKCSAPLPTTLPACPKCFFISRPSKSTTYFDIMGLSDSPNRFNVDPVDLKHRFRELQRVIHPDKWSGKGSEVQDVAVQLSSIVNKAYTTLLNPYTRAEYIMQLEDIHIGESDSLDDPELIMEIMEAREELETAEDREDVERIREENQEKIDEIIPELSAAVAAKDWDAAKNATVKLKYLQGINAAAEAWPNTAHDH